MALKGSTNSHGITKMEVVQSSGQEGSAAGLAYSKQGNQYKRQWCHSLAIKISN